MGIFVDKSQRSSHWSLQWKLPRFWADTLEEFSIVDCDDLERRPCESVYVRKTDWPLFGKRLMMLEQQRTSFGLKLVAILVINLPRKLGSRREHCGNSELLIINIDLYKNIKTVLIILTPLSLLFFIMQTKNKIVISTFLVVLSSIIFKLYN